VPAVFRKEDVERFEIKLLLPLFVSESDLDPCPAERAPL
jgi:hypothetical protein